MMPCPRAWNIVMWILVAELVMVAFVDLITHVMT